MRMALPNLLFARKQKENWLFLSASLTYFVTLPSIKEYTMKRLLSFLLLMPLMAHAGHQILSPNFKSLQVIVNNDWMAQPVMRLGTTDVFNIGFDELSHKYHRLVYHLEPCNPDWTPTEGLFESDWLDGFNDRPIEDYENSLNTTVLYTHYRMQIPNEETRLKMSGNYRLHIIDEDDDNQEVICMELRVVEPLMNVQLGVTTNTDVDLNTRHQQLSMNIAFNGLRVTRPDEQIQTFVMQNGREDNMKQNVRPNYQTPQGLRWEHNRGLLFEGGNEYHKFEMLDPSHTTLGLASLVWDEEGRRFHAEPYMVEPRRNYVYDVDANGAFIIRNSDNVEIDYTSDYIFVHYKLKALRHYDNAQVRIDGRWATESPEAYTMEWNEEDQTYNAVVLQKLGYYNYQLLMYDLDGTSHLMPEEGSFYQTENRYQGYVYYKGTSERSWRLVGYKEITFRAP